MALRVIGKQNRKMLGDIEKGSIFFAFGATRATKKDIKMARMSKVGHQETLGAKKVNVFNSLKVNFMF
jgi:hypothetical protein